MESAANMKGLKEAFNDQLHQNKKRVKRQEKTFAAIGKKGGENAKLE